MAMNMLGNGLSEANHHEDALSVGEAELAMKRRVGAPEASILVVQGNLADTYEDLGRFEEALRLKRDVYARRLMLYGEENEGTIIAGYNYATVLVKLQRHKEAKSLSRKTMPVARRVLGETHEVTLRMRSNYAAALVNGGATLDDLREAVTTLEELTRTARRVFGGAHPFTTWIEGHLRNPRAVLAAREGDGVSSVRVCDGVAAMTPGGA